MSEIPDGVDGIMRALLPRTGFYVPDDILGMWFPPGVAAGIIDNAARRAAEGYGAKFDCRFWYFPERKAGCFAKKPKSQDSN
jgi:hypothetical protein